MTIDNTSLKVLANYCAAAAESMGWTLMRTAYSTFVKETEDFSCQVLTKEGLTVASPTTFGATWFTGLDYGRVIDRFDYQPGDICVVSDPYSGYVATHAPDLHMWMPVFRDGELVCFVANHIHNTDIGGAVPASLSRALTEVHQEGLRIPPMRLMRDGKLNRDLLDLINVNVRLPEQNWGDMNAQIACVTVGERKIQEIVNRFGVRTFVDGLEQLIDYGEEQSRALIRTLPDGDYFSQDFVDEDETNGYPVRIAITLRIRGEEAIIDYTGSDPQLVNSINMPTGGNERHALAMVGVVYSLYCLDPGLTLNYGLIRPVRAVLPEGTVVNAVRPAAVGMRSLLNGVLQSVTIAAFAQVCPDRMPASPGGGSSIMNVKTATRDGRSIMASIGPVGGGAGGGPNADGAEGSGANGSFLKNTPVEINEAEVPIEILRYGLVPDSGGYGRWRGGLGLQMEFRVFAPQTMVTARNRNRSRFGPSGFQGGGPGALSRFVRNPGTPQAVELGSIDVVHCDPGDVILIQGAGAGGYGDPLSRPVESVQFDVRRGFVSIAMARDAYGVVIDDDGLTDIAATESLRASMRKDRSPEPENRSPGRIEFEAIWTLARYEALTCLLAEIPVSWRYYVKHRIFEAIGASRPEAPDDASAVHAAYVKLANRFPELAGNPALKAARMAAE